MCDILGLKKRHTYQNKAPRCVFNEQRFNYTSCGKFFMYSEVKVNELETQASSNGTNNVTIKLWDMKIWWCRKLKQNVKTNFYAYQLLKIFKTFSWQIFLRICWKTFSSLSIKVNELRSLVYRVTTCLQILFSFQKEWSSTYISNHPCMEHLSNTKYVKSTLNFIMCELFSLLPLSQVQIWNQMIIVAWE